MKSLALLCLFAFPALAQSNPACPGATGPNPHCTTVSWTAPAGGATPTGYNVYRATATGVCTWQGSTSGPITPPAGCAKVANSTAPTTTATDNSSPANVLAEGTTYFYVVTSANSSGESAPSVEASAKIPVLLPGVPTNPGVVAH